MGTVRLVTLLVLTSGLRTLAAQQPALGPRDKPGLPATDTGRVGVGDLAPDFSLESFAGPPVTLSQYRGVRNVVLVFYRGHW